MIRVLIVDDHAAIAEALAMLLAGFRELSVVGTAGDEASAARLIASRHPDVVLCDVMLDGRDDGFSLLGRFHATTRFLMYTAFDFPSHHFRAIEGGAAGLVSKAAETGELVRAIRRVAAGGFAFEPDVLASARQAPRRPAPREQQVLELLAEGASNDEMAHRLGLRVKTVEGTIRRLFDRYSVDNRTQLAGYAARQGWFTSEPVGSPDGADPVESPDGSEGTPNRA